MVEVGEQTERGSVIEVWDRPKEACLEKQPSGLCFGGVFDLSEAEEEGKLPALGSMCWQVLGHTMKGKWDLILICLASLEEQADFGEM